MRSTRRRPPAWLALSAALAAGPGLAVAADPPKPAPPPAKPAEAPVTASELTVTADPTQTRTSIDRQSYDITKDPLAATGSVADVLRNVPSLSVDLQGAVSLRGDTSVTILVDGKPSTMFRGDTAQALQSIPASQFERVEVITNPTAAMSPDGSAGIINLITRKNVRPGFSGSLRGGVDPYGRWTAGLNANRKAGKLTLSLNASLRRDRRQNDSDDVRTGFDAAGARLFTNAQQTHATNGGLSWNLRLGADYDPDAKTRISAAAYAGGFENDANRVSHLAGVDGAGHPVRTFDRTGDYGSSVRAGDLEVTYRRTFAGEQHDLVVSVERGDTQVGNRSRNTNVTGLPTALVTYDARDNANDGQWTEAKADYQRPMPHGGRLKAGSQWQLEDDDLPTDGFLAAASPDAPADPGQTDRFHFRRRIAALYATYEQPIGKFTILAGLRLETSHLDIDDITTALRVARDETHLYPTLHLGYRFDDKRQLTASYSQRVSRPDASALNPFVFINSPFDRGTGNPALRPEQTDQYELRYDVHDGPTSWSLNAYYKRNTGGVSNIATDLGGGVFLNTWANLLSSRTAGLELSASGRLSAALTYNLNGEVRWTSIDANAPGLVGPRTGTGVGGNATVNWQVTPKDFLQFTGSVSNPQVSPQGFTRPWGLLNLGYRHKFSDRLAFVLTAQDVAGSFKFSSGVDTPTLSSRTHTDPHRRTISASLVLTFGRGPKRDPTFDYGSSN